MTSNALWSPFDESNIADPYSMYARLRGEGPVFLAQTGEYIVASYDGVKTALRSSDFRSGNRLEWLERGVNYFRNHDEDLGNIYKAINSFLLFLNGTEHIAMRQLVMKTWNDREVHDIIVSTADDLLRNLHGTFDIIKDYAQEFPAIEISRIMGLPMDDYAFLRKTTVTMVRSLDLYHSLQQLVELNEASGVFVKYFEQLVKDKRARPDGGLASKLVHANDKEKLLNDEQMISLLLFLFIAGEETTTNSIGNAIYNLIRTNKYYPLRNNASLMPSAVEELFRYDGPVHLLGRITKTDTVLDGYTIPANSSVTLLVASANRDPKRFSNPDSLDLDRNPNPHLAFGYGTHFCMGEWLGKLQTRVGIERFMNKFSSATLVEQKMSWYKNLSVRGRQSVIVNTTA